MGFACAMPACAWLCSSCLPLFPPFPGCMPAALPPQMSSISSGWTSKALFLSASASFLSLSLLSSPTLVSSEAAE